LICEYVDSPDVNLDSFGFHHIYIHVAYGIVSHNLYSPQSLQLCFDTTLSGIVSYAENTSIETAHLQYRTMKRVVESELTIPPQSRFLVPIELGKVEKHVSIPLHIYGIFDNSLILAAHLTDRCMTKR